MNTGLHITLTATRTLLFILVNFIMRNSLFYRGYITHFLILPISERNLSALHFWFALQRLARCCSLLNWAYKRDRINHILSLNDEVGLWWEKVQFSQWHLYLSSLLRYFPIHFYYFHIQCINQSMETIYIWHLLIAIWKHKVLSHCNYSTLL